MQTESTSALRAAVARVSKKRQFQGRRYPPELSKQIVAHVVAERSRGVAVRSTARSLGLSYPTIQRWLRAKPNKPNGFRSVAVKPLPPVVESVGTLSLVTRHGYRVEGLGREDVAFLLRLLA